MSDKIPPFRRPGESQEDAGERISEELRGSEEHWLVVITERTGDASPEVVFTTIVSTEADANQIVAERAPQGSGYGYIVTRPRIA